MELVPQEVLSLLDHLVEEQEGKARKLEIMGGTQWVLTVPDINADERVKGLHAFQTAVGYKGGQQKPMFPAGELMVVETETTQVFLFSLCSLLCL